MKLGSWSWRRRESELDEEIASHMRMAIADRIARGESRAEAELAVRREFGSPALVKEVTRSMWTGARVNRLMTEFTIALRTLRRTPQFSIAATACIGLGIGASATVFSLLNAIFLQPLPYSNAASVVSITTRNVSMGSAGASITPAQLEAWGRAASISAISTWRTISADLTGPEGLAESVAAARITPALPRVLGVRPGLGRLFEDREDQVGAHLVAILGWDLWRQRFHGDSAIIGRPIRVGSESYRIVGVMPRGYSFPEGTQMWMPLVIPQLPPDVLFYEGSVARLTPGSDIRRVRTEVAHLERDLRASDAYAKWTTNVETLREALVGRLRKPIYLLQAAAALVLLVACTNVAALLLARGTHRQRELAVRAALGAGRAQLIGHILIECGALSLLGGLAGILMAAAAVPAFSLAFPDGTPSYADLRLHSTAVIFALVTSGLSAMVFGLLPALRAGRSGPAMVLRAAPGAIGTKPVAANRTLGLLLVTELSAAVVLMVAAALLIATYDALQKSLGFRPDALMSFQVSLPFRRYTDDVARDAFFHRLETQLRQSPGVTEVATTINSIPMNGAPNGTWSFHRVGQSIRPAGDRRITRLEYVSPNYLTVLGMPMRSGRQLSDPDRSPEPEGIVNETFAKRYSRGNATVIGERIVIESPGGRESAAIHIVGVVADFRSDRPPADILPTVYLAGTRGSSLRSFLVRGRGADAAALSSMIRTALNALDPVVPARRLQTLDRLVDRSLWRERLQARALGIFASMAVILAMFGVYGVLSYAVAQRGVEFGIRRAIGASTERLAVFVLLGIARTTAIGVAFGIGASILLGRTLSGFLYGVSPGNPKFVLGAAAGVSAVAMIASLVPAWRAARADPLTAIRSN